MSSSLLRKALPALPETADELKRVAASVNASEADVILGPDATETRVKQSKLDQYRIVYFATHSLLAGEVEALRQSMLAMIDHPRQPYEGRCAAQQNCAAYDGGGRHSALAA